MSDRQQINGFLPAEDPDELAYYGVAVWLAKQGREIRPTNIYAIYSQCFEAVTHLSPALQEATRQRPRPEIRAWSLGLASRIVEANEEARRLEEMRAPIAGGW